MTRVLGAVVPLTVGEPSCTTSEARRLDGARSSVRTPSVLRLASVFHVVLLACGAATPSPVLAQTETVQTETVQTETERAETRPTETEPTETEPTETAQSATARRRRERDLQTFILGSPYADAALVVTSLTMGALGTFVLDPPSTARPPFNGGRSHSENTAAARTSDVIFGVTMAGSLGFAFLVEHREGRRGVALLRAPLVIGESVLFTLGVVSMLKNVLGECRPRAWDEATQTCVGTNAGDPTKDDLRSWPSGHAAGTFAVVGATLGLWLLPTGHRPRFAPLFGATAALALTTASLRIVAGAHDAVDTTSGALLGIGLGFATAAMHLVRPTAPRVSIGASAHAIAIGVHGAF